MFNFDEFENVTNKRSSKSLQASDVKVYASELIRFSDAAIEKLEAQNKNVVIAKNHSTGQVAIFSTNQENLGRPLTGKGKNQFTNGSVNSILGGQHSEWNITGDGATNPATGDVYYELTEVVNGADERQRLADLANENSDTPASEENGDDVPEAIASQADTSVEA